MLYQDRYRYQDMKWPISGYEILVILPSPAIKPFKCKLTVEKNSFGRSSSSYFTALFSKWPHFDSQILSHWIHIIPSLCLLNVSLLYGLTPKSDIYYWFSRNTSVPCHVVCLWPVIQENTIKLQNGPNESCFLGGFCLMSSLKDMVLIFLYVFPTAYA